MTEVIKRAVDAEIHAAAWMRALGFVDAQETTLSADAGIDVISTQAVAQVKFKAAQVGRPELQGFVGAAHAHPEKSRLFFSWKGYSSHAFDYAEQTGIALFDYELEGRFRPLNRHAQVLCGSGPRTGQAPVWPAAVAASWWTPRRILQAVLGVVLLGVVIFFLTHPDALIQVLVFAGGLFLVATGLGFTPKKTRRRRKRRR